MNSNLIGKTLANRYYIEELIGTGGMASVYRAKCELLNREVAIKVLRDAVKDDINALASFKKEAQAAAQLSHNNIVSVFDVGEDDGIDYMVMEYVNGATLKKYILENGPLPWQEVCDFGIQICHALEAAHSKGVVHRDIKPQNIIVTEDKELKVTDFGIAKAATGETMQIGDKSAMGSVHYISPEQARGGFTDARSDIYSLGIVLFEMLAGKVPFDGESAVSIALMHIEKSAPSVLTYNKSIPASLSAVVAKAISKEQSLRYQSVTDFYTDLHAVLAEQPVTAGAEKEEEPEEDLGTTKKFKIPETETVPEKKKKGKKAPKTEEQKKADKTATALAFLTIVVLFLAAFGVYSFMKKSTGEVLVPDFKNMLLEDAAKLAAENGITISDELEYSLSDDVEEGKIIFQTPDAKTYIKEDEPVHVVVSIGSSGGNISVPYVKGIPVEQAIEKIIEADLTYLLNEETSTTVPVGQVIRQSPEVGTKLNKNDVVTIHISTGKPAATQTPAPVENVIVPPLYGETHTSAEALCLQNNLRLVSVSKKESDLPEDTVISQSPEAGKPVAPGTSVSIVISTGTGTAENVFVPPSIIPVQTASPADSQTEVPEAEDEVKTMPFEFPIDGSEGTAVVKITVDGDTYYEKIKNKGETVSVDISGEGEMKVVAFVDGKIVKALFQTPSTSFSSTKSNLPFQVIPAGAFRVLVPTMSM